MQLKKVECDPECGFMIKSHDENEIAKVVIAHVKNNHQMNLTANDVRKKMMDA